MTIPQPSDPKSFLKPNYSWPVFHLVGSSHLRPGALHISLRTHKTQPSGWKKRTNEQARAWVSSKRKRREFVTPLCSSPCIYRLSQACISVKLPRPVSSAPFCWLFSSALLYQLSLSLSIYLYVFSGTFLPSSTSGIAGDPSFRPFVWVLHQNRRRDPEWHLHTQKRMLPIVSHYRNLGKLLVHDLINTKFYKLRGNVCKFKKYFLYTLRMGKKPNYIDKEHLCKKKVVSYCRKFV